MASARSKRTYFIAWDGCGSLPLRNGRRITAGRDRHFKTNHRSAFPISVLSPQDRQILKTASYELVIKTSHLVSSFNQSILYFQTKVTRRPRRPLQDPVLRGLLQNPVAALPQKLKPCRTSPSYLSNSNSPTPIWRELKHFEWSRRPSLSQQREMWPKNVSL